MKHKIFNKAFSFVLVLVMVITTMTLVPLTASAANNLVPPVIPGVSGAGTEASPYLIADADDLAALIAAAKNEQGNGIYAGTITYVTFTDDIALPAETAANYTFILDAYGTENPSNISWRMDGGNHTISGMKEPLFGSFAKTENGIEIKNLKLQGDIVATGGRYAGALVGATYGNVTIDNCHFDGSIKCTYYRDKNVIGGLVGLVSKFNFTIKNCTNSATILNDAVTAGGEAYAGGIVGQMGHYTDAGEIVHIIENCSNFGTVTVTDTDILMTTCVGGIVGNITPNTIRDNVQYSAMVKNCANTGTLSSNQSYAKIGALIGLAHTQNDSNGSDSFATLDIIGGLGENGTAYNRDGILDIHLFDGNNDFACNVSGCNYVRCSSASGHTWSNACDAECNTCGTTRAVLHAYENACDDYCDACGATRTVSHQYDSDCDETCNNYYCGETRTSLVPHSYTNSCDTSCNLCHTLRTAPHNYRSNCDESCDSCPATRIAPANHNYDGNCDATCDRCDTTRTAPHAYSSLCDETCNSCTARRSSLRSHAYDNACDESCNACDKQRTIQHTYANACDADCNVCGLTRPASSHVFSNECDADCNVCLAPRTAPHVYDSVCASACNLCGMTRAASHTYDNVCDTHCNICGLKREISHVFDDESDTKCNVCDFERVVEADDETDMTETTTAAETAKAPETTTAPVGTMPNMPMPSGCSGSLNSTYAVIALVAILGFAFVAKKKENE